MHFSLFYTVTIKQVSLGLTFHDWLCTSLCPPRPCDRCSHQDWRAPDVDVALTHKENQPRCSGISLLALVCPDGREWQFRLWVYLVRKIVVSIGFSIIQSLNYTWKTSNRSFFIGRFLCHPQVIEPTNHFGLNVVWHSAHAHIGFDRIKFCC